MYMCVVLCLCMIFIQPSGGEGEGQGRGRDNYQGNDVLTSRVLQSTIRVNGVDDTVVRRRGDVVYDDCVACVCRCDVV